MLLEDDEDQEVADEDAEHITTKKKGKLVARPNQKKPVYRSNIQVLGTMASTFSNLSAGHCLLARQHDMLLRWRRKENGRKREGRTKMIDLKGSLLFGKKRTKQTGSTT